MGPLLVLILPVINCFLDLFLLRKTADFKVSISILRARGVLPSSSDIQLQTEHLASQVRSLLSQELLL